jgi:signal transduction histidine kinase
LRLHREDDQAVIAIEDHGLGIPEADQGRIFDQFFRARTEHNRLIPGAGLGLTLAAQTAKAHSGTISVRSRPGEGSTFSIRIPLEGSTS